MNSSISTHSYKPQLSDAEIQRRQQWQEEIYAELRANSNDQYVEVAGVRLFVQAQVAPPIWHDSRLMATAVQSEVRSGEQVLDMGTGTGIQALIAAKQGATVRAVDISQACVACAQRNVKEHCLRNSIVVVQSNLFEQVFELYDLIIFNPAYRWFKPRDFVEMSETDENYRTLITFMQQVRNYLVPGGECCYHFLIQVTYLI